MNRVLEDAEVADFTNAVRERLNGGRRVRVLADWKLAGEGDGGEVASWSGEAFLENDALVVEWAEAGGERFDFPSDEASYITLRFNIIPTLARKRERGAATDDGDQPQYYNVMSWGDWVAGDLRVLESDLCRVYGVSAGCSFYRRKALALVMLWVKGVREVEEWQTSALAPLGNALLEQMRAVIAREDHAVQPQQIEARLHSAREPDDQFGTAVLALTKGAAARNVKPAAGNKRHLVCYNCRVAGHIAKDCKAPRVERQVPFSAPQPKNIQGGQAKQ